MDRNAYHRYLSDIGWATFISPYTAKLVDISPIDNGNTYTTKVMENGGLYIQNNESIEETTIHHLLGIKKQVYNAIYPGEGVFSLSFHNWRSHWENIPVFDDEVQIQNNNVLFSSKNIANTGFVLE